jgi:predicted RNA-binding protein with RPS1 domain
MILEKNKTYNFNVIERGINSDGKTFSIIEDAFSKTHFYPKNFSENSIDLTVTEVKNENGKIKYIFKEIEPIFNSTNFNYEIGKIYPFKFLKIETKYGDKPSILNSRLLLVDLNNDTLLYYVDLFEWQLSSKYNPEIILCEVKNISIQKKTIKLKQSIKNLLHPVFEKKKEYDFEFIKDFEPEIDGKKSAFVIVKGIDNYSYKLFKPFNHEITLNKIKYTFNGINNYGALIFRQFVPFEKIVKYRALKRLTYNKFRDIIDNPIITKMFNDYDNKENLWIISFCNILEDEFSKNIKLFEFEQALIYVEVFIEFENWILNSGFLDTFKNNKESVEVNKRKLLEFESKKSSLEIILNDEIDFFFTNIITSNTKIRDINEITKAIHILNFTFNSEIQIAHKIQIKFFKILGQNSFFLHNKSESNTLLSYLQKAVVEKDKNIFDPIFTNSNKRDKYFINNSELFNLIELNLLQTLIYFEFNLKEHLRLSLTKFMRYKSLFVETKSVRLHLIKNALNLSFNSEILKDYVTNLNWANFDNLVKNQNFKTYNFKRELKKSSTLIDNFERKIEIKANIVGENKFGYIVDVFNNDAILPKKWLPESYLQNIEFKQDREVNFSILQLDEQFGNILILPKLKSTLHKFIDTNIIELNSIVKGYVKRIEDYGAFIDLGDTDGLLHNSEIGHSPLLLKKGQEIKLKIIGIEHVDGKKLIELSKKVIEEKLKPNFNQVYTGVITNILDYGIFVSISSEVSGLIKKENISYQNIFLNECVKVNDVVSVKLINQHNFNKLEFSIKSVQENPFVNSEIFLNKSFKGSIIAITKSLITVKFLNYQLIGFYRINTSKEQTPKDAAINKIEINDIINFSINHINDENQSITIDIDPNNILKYNITYINENIDLYYLIEIGNSFEHYAYLTNKNSDKLNYLNWAKYFYGFGFSPKSYYLNLFISYQAIISQMNINKNSSNSIDENIAKTIINANKLIEEINEQNLTIQIFPTLTLINKTLEILSCFGSNNKENMKFLFAITELENFDFDIIDKTAKLVLSYNLISNDLQDESLKFQRWKQLHQYLKEGLLIVESEDEKDIKLRTELFNIIKTGENHTNEFKASLYKPVHDAKKREILVNFTKQLNIAIENDNKNNIEFFKNKIDEMQSLNSVKGVKHTAMKNLVAFANSKGGNLIIGLEDNMNILGLEYETEAQIFDIKTQDNYLNELDSLITNYIGNDFHQYIESTEYIKTDEGHLLWIKIKKANKPIFLKLDKNGSLKKEFFIRGRVSCRFLDIEEYTKYFSENFIN